MTAPMTNCASSAPDFEHVAALAEAWAAAPDLRLGEIEG